MRKFLQDYLTFSKSELLGVISLLIIILALSIAPYIMKSKEFELDHDEFNKMVNDYYNFRVKNVESEENVSNELQPFIFDPNVLSKDGFMKLGLSEKQASVICNYRNKGGKFYKVQDFGKIYGITDEQFHVLAPFIRIKSSYRKSYQNEEYKSNYKKDKYQNNYKKDKYQNNYKKQDLIININTADLDELVKLRGIGPIYANRIIKYRNLLGGFSSTEQLYEVYGLRPGLVDSISLNINIESNMIKKINLNDTDIKSLMSHPYISKNEARRIDEYISIVDSVENIEELQIHKIISDSTFQKIEQYLSLQ